MTHPLPVSTPYDGPDRRTPAPAIDADAIRDAVAAGIREAVSDPRLWDAAGDAMRRHAQSAAGGWLFGGIGALIRRASWVIAAVAAIYALGGWSAVLVWLKAGASHGG